MRYSGTVLLILLHFLGCTGRYKESKKIFLDNGWKFKTDDNLKYSNLLYNDSKWNFIQVSKSWQKQGYDYVGFAWYRTKVLIPSSLKRNQQTDSLKIYLGEITDSHQVFMNGSIIGENGLEILKSYSPDSTFIDKPIIKGNTKYSIAVNDPRILWDKINVLSVRVFNKRYNGGLIAGTPFIGIVNLEDYIEYDQNFYSPDSTGGLDTNLTITNKFNKQIIGSLIINCRIVESNKLVHESNFPVDLKPEESKSLPISLPITSDQIKVSLIFKEHQLKELVRDSLIVPFVIYK
ncbi:MAG: hypothetical protein K9I02_05370 [Haliscomenobacter sp.]|nr:hypothetical protein [Haliscomenobacter sp.]